MSFPYMKADSKDIRKAVSALGVDKSSFCPPRESQSFTHCSPPIIERAEHNIAERENVAKPLLKCTRQLNSEEPYYIYEDMLNYRGEKYSLKYIAPVWKKDCRMWLWKTSKKRIHKKVSGSPEKRKPTLEQLMENLTISDNISNIAKSRKRFDASK